MRKHLALTVIITAEEPLIVGGQWKLESYITGSAVPPFVTIESLKAAASAVEEAAKQAGASLNKTVGDAVKSAS